jgi:hypothetical protein
MIGDVDFGVGGGGGGEGCDPPRQHSRKGGKLCSKINLLTGKKKKKILWVQRILNYWAKYKEIQQIIAIFKSSWSLLE